MEVMEKFAPLMKHLKILYYAFIIVIILDTGYQLYAIRFIDLISSSFNRGYELGSSSHSYKIGDTIHPEDPKPFFHSKQLQNLHHNPYTKKESTETIVVSDTMNINVEVVTFSANIFSQKPLRYSMWNHIVQIGFLFISLLTSFWAIILGIRLLINIGKSIFRKDIFNLKTIKLCKRYALILAALSISIGVERFANEYAVSQYFANTDWDFILSLPIDLNGVSTAILVYMFSEILRIGYLLKQEQELTI